MSSQFLQESSVGNSVKSFTKVQVNIHSLSLIHWVGHLVIERDQISQAGPGSQEPSQIGFIHKDHDIFTPQFRREEASDGLITVLWLLCPHARWQWQNRCFPTKQYQDHKRGCHTVWVLVLPPNLPPDVEERKPLPCYTLYASLPCRNSGSKCYFTYVVGGSRWVPFSQVSFTIIIVNKSVSNFLEVTKILYFLYRILNWSKMNFSYFFSRFYWKCCVN